MIKALAICGPTASGKTALSLRLCKKMPFEIISLDSMQIYKGMDIGTAKATEAERASVPHYMLDIISPLEDYSCGKYREDALLCVREILNKKKLPLFVGGTGLYLDSLNRNSSDEVEKSDTGYRQRLLLECDSEEKRQKLWQRLYDVDPESAEAIHYNNLRRVIRALEVYERTGKPKSYFDRLSKMGERDIDIKVVSLDFHNRESLYERINLRVDEMFEKGLYSEVLNLYKGGLLREDSTASRAIGYKEVISAIKGEISIDEARELIKLSSRRYAKRQLTWFRHIEDRITVYLDGEDGELLDVDAVFQNMLSEIKGLSLGED